MCTCMYLKTYLPFIDSYVTIDNSSRYFKISKIASENPFGEKTQLPPHVPHKQLPSIVFSAKSLLIEDTSQGPGSHNGKVEQKVL